MDGVVAEAGRVDVVVQMLLEGVGVGVVDIETRIFQSYPDIMLGTFAYAIDDIAGKTLCVACCMFEVVKDAAGTGVVHPVKSSSIRTDPETVTAVLEETDQLVVTDRGWILFMVDESGKGFCIFIKEVQAIAISAYPKILTAVDIHRADIVAAEAGRVVVRVMVMIVAVAVRYEIDDTLVFRADPDIAGSILCQPGDEIAGYGIFAAILSEHLELILFPVISVEPSTAGSYPDIALAVFYDVGNKIIAETAFVAGIVAIDRDLIAIVFVETVPGAKPHKTAAVLEDGKDIVLRETCIDIQMFEPKTRPRLLCDSQATQEYRQGHGKGFSFDRFE